MQKYCQNLIFCHDWHLKLNFSLQNQKQWRKNLIREVCQQRLPHEQRKLKIKIYVKKTFFSTVQTLMLTFVQFCEVFIVNFDISLQLNVQESFSSEMIKYFASDHGKTVTSSFEDADNTYKRDSNQINFFCWWWQYKPMRVFKMSKNVVTIVYAR